MTKIYIPSIFLLMQVFMQILKRNRAQKKFINLWYAYWFKKRIKHNKYSIAIVQIQIEIIYFLHW